VNQILCDEVLLDTAQALAAQLPSATRITKQLMRDDRAVVGARIEHEGGCSRLCSVRRRQRTR
jgi:hypothetical protein